MNFRVKKFLTVRFGFKVKRQLIKPVIKKYEFQSQKIFNSKIWYNF